MKPYTSVILICFIITLFTGVISQTDSTDLPTLQNVETESIDSELLESIENIKEFFIGLLETAVNNTLPESDFLYSIFPELEEYDLQDMGIDPMIKEDLRKLSEKARELGLELDKNKDGQITMEEVQPEDTDSKTKVDNILAAIVGIQNHIDSQFEDQDVELFNEDISQEIPVPQDEDLIDLDEESIYPRDEL